MTEDKRSKQGLFPQEQEQEKVGFNWWVIALFVIILIGGILLLEPVRAEHDVLYPGDKVTGLTLLCDTQEQLESILTAHAENGFAGGKVRYNELQRQRNEYFEPLCVQGNMTDSVIIEELISVFGGLEYPSGVRTVWVVRVTYPKTGKTYFITVSNPVREKKQFGEDI